MPIKVRSTFKKQEFEYESPDGEKWLISYVENEGRKYLSIGKEGQDEKEHTTWDVPMILDIADQIRGMTSRVPKAQKAPPRLKSPKIQDHRNEGLVVSNQIESDVEESMANYDDTVRPMESFSPPAGGYDEWIGVRSGVDPNVAAQEVEDTPEEFKRVKNVSDWVDRSGIPRQKRPNVARGAKGDRFGRVGAGDIV